MQFDSSKPELHFKLNSLDLAYVGQYTLSIKLLFTTGVGNACNFTFDLKDKCQTSHMTIENVHPLSNIFSDLTYTLGDFDQKV